MNLVDTINTEDPHSTFNIAADFIHYTSRSLFLTGKAGTGKTTLLKHICRTTTKRFVVLAPTGVAAINAGGVTIHSFFGIPPFPAFVPEPARAPAPQVYDRSAILRHIRYSAEKRDLIQDLDLLIIDEVSMLRCDLLDVIDTILRHVRNQPDAPFGNLQMLFIGDLHQLPPVVKPEDWQYLLPHYNTPFFFESKAIRKVPPINLQLTKVYRQNEQRFVDVLNRIRNNEVDADDLELLHSRFNPSFEPKPEDNFITLTTHNYKADQINDAELKKLPGKLYKFRGVLEGDFPDHNLPAEIELLLKPGAQVMFLRNDREGRYYNGKIAVVSSIDDTTINVIFPGQNSELKVPLEIWQNKKYGYDQVEEKVTQEVAGSYSQFPIRLAWAITVHKSQGLTFQKAVVDLGDSFAPGQVYVALSRCTTLEGLVLKSKIRQDVISTDSGIREYHGTIAGEDTLPPLLEQEKKIYRSTHLTQLFSFTKMKRIIDDHHETLVNARIKLPGGALALGETLSNKMNEVAAVSAKFLLQLTRLLRDVSNDEIPDAGARLVERLKKGSVYFYSEVKSGMLEPIQAHLAIREKKTKKYLAAITAVKNILIRKLDAIQRSSYEGIPLLDDPTLSDMKLEVTTDEPEKKEKGASQRETLSMFRNGMTAQEIAAARGMATSTIEGHLATFIRMGDLDVSSLLSEEKLAAILMELESGSHSGLGTVKAALGDKYSWGEIKFAAKHLEWKEDHQRRQKE
jgi:hypothetical protein